jgi:hypothetical protein
MILVPSVALGQGFDVTVAIATVSKNPGLRHLQREARCSASLERAARTFVSVSAGAATGPQGKLN